MYKDQDENHIKEEDQLKKLQEAQGYILKTLRYKMILWKPSRTCKHLISKEQH